METSLYLDGMLSDFIASVLCHKIKRSILYNFFRLSNSVIRNLDLVRATFDKILWHIRGKNKLGYHSNGPFHFLSAPPLLKDRDF